MQQRPIDERFWEKVCVEPNTGCFLWTGQLDRRGYGILWTGKRSKGLVSSTRAPRVAWELHRGALNRDQVVCHRCDTPACVNVDHLFVGSRADNIRDAIQKGRHVRGETVGTARLTVANVALIRELAASGATQTDIAKRFSVGRTTVNRVLSGATWRHVAS